MAISMSRAKHKQPRNDENTSPGRGIARTLNIRAEETRSSGSAFFLDFEVVRHAPGELRDESKTPEELRGGNGKAIETPAGFKSCFKVFPDEAKSNGQYTKAEVKELEEGKIQAAVAAVAGWSVEEAGNVNDEYFALATAKPRSSLAGRLFEYVAHESKKYPGKTGYYEIFPCKEGDQEATAKVAAKPVKAAPPPPAPKAAPTFPPAGWKPYPGAEGCYLSPDESEALWEADLRAKFGL
jgi:hypothetical protein